MNDEKQPVIGATPTVQVQLSAQEAMILPVLHVMIRGVVSTLSQQGVPLPVIYFALARTLGLSLAGGVNGPLSDVLKLRADLTRGFDDGIKQVPITSLGLAAPGSGG